MPPDGPRWEDTILLLPTPLFCLYILHRYYTWPFHSAFTLRLNARPTNTALEFLNDCLPARFSSCNPLDVLFNPFLAWFWIWAVGAVGGLVAGWVGYWWWIARSEGKDTYISLRFMATGK